LSNNANAPELPRPLNRIDTDGIAWNPSLLFRYRDTFAALFAWETAYGVTGPSVLQLMIVVHFIGK